MSVILFDSPSLGGVVEPFASRVPALDAQSDCSGSDSVRLDT